MTEDDFENQGKQDGDVLGDMRSVNGDSAVFAVRSLLALW
jgi:hypothetical protein